MKKVIAVFLAAAIMMLLSFQVLAAPSVTGDVDYGQVFSDQGTVIWSDVTRENYSDEILTIHDFVNSLTDQLSVQEAMEKFTQIKEIKLFDEKSVYLSEGYSIMKDMHFLSLMKELIFKDVVPTEENPVRVTFTANNMTDTMEVYVLYYCPIHGWELLKTERTADNQVTAAFHAGTSLAALVYIDKGAAADTSAGTSPKTGEDNFTFVLTIAALALAGFGFFAVKKIRKEA